MGGRGPRRTCGPVRLTGNPGEAHPGPRLSGAIVSHSREQNPDRGALRFPRGEATGSPGPSQIPDPGPAPRFCPGQGPRETREVWGAQPWSALRTGGLGPGIRTGPQGCAAPAPHTPAPGADGGRRPSPGDPGHPTHRLLHGGRHLRTGLRGQVGRAATARFRPVLSLAPRAQNSQGTLTQPPHPLRVGLPPMTPNGWDSGGWSVPCEHLVHSS